MGIIYMIENTITGEKYIGQTIGSLENRLRGHIFKSYHEEVKPGSLQYAIREYGTNCFIATVLEKCRNSELSDKERYYIKLYDTYNNGYNKTGGGGFSGSAVYLREKVFEYLKQNLTPTQITAKIGCSLTFVKSVADEHGIKLNTSTSSRPLKIVQFDKNWNPIKIYNSITSAYRDTYGVSISTFQHTIRAACGTYDEAYGYRWAMLNDLFIVKDGKTLVFRSPLDLENYLNGSEFWVNKNVIYTDISSTNDTHRCKFCGKEIPDNLEICDECAVKHPRSMTIGPGNKIRIVNKQDVNKQDATRKSATSTDTKHTNTTRETKAAHKPTLKDRLPDKDTLEKLIETHTYKDICRMYNVYERTLREKLKEYGIYERRNASVSDGDEPGLIIDVISYGLGKAAEKNSISTWKLRNILRDWEIPNWMYSNNIPVRATQVQTGASYSFESCWEAARALKGQEGVSQSALNSYRYKIGKAAKEHREYLGYIWSEIDKQQILAEVSKIISEKGGQNL